jgi:hypothetical protein
LPPTARATVNGDAERQTRCELLRRGVEWRTCQTYADRDLPAEEIFAPLHVYLKVSWHKAEDVPADTRGIRAPARTPTKLRTNKSAVWLWLGVQEKQDAPPRKKWVPFSGLVDVALLSLPTKR